MTNKQHNMTFAKECPFTGVTNFMEIPMDGEAFFLAYAKWMDGMLIQDAFPTLTPELREFIKTGITPAKWNEMFGT